MIQLTRLNGVALVVNCDLIKFMESNPDTVLTLVSGEKVIVLEPPSAVIEKIVDFRRKISTREPSELVESGNDHEKNNTPASSQSYEG
jgi:flagellar protein FlbD